jgi:hypothetical protein
MQQNCHHARHQRLRERSARPASDSDGDGDREGRADDPSGAAAALSSTTGVALPGSPGLAEDEGTAEDRRVAVAPPRADTDDAAAAGEADTDGASAFPMSPAAGGEAVAGEDPAVTPAPAPLRLRRSERVDGCVGATFSTAAA